MPVPGYFVKRRRGWNDQHHVTQSKVNDRAPKGQRAYFDYLPLVPMRLDELSIETGDSAEQKFLLSDPFFLSSFSARRPNVPSVDLLAAAAVAPLPSVQSARGESRELLGGSLPHGFNMSPRSPAASSRSPVKSKRPWSEKPQEEGVQLAPAFLQFVEWAEAKHKHLVALWRKLDKDGSGFLHKVELSKGLKELCCPVKSDDLWNCLDSDRRGTIEFEEFAPRSSRLLGRFKYWANSQFGSMGGLFKVAAAGKALYIKDFKRACRDRGVPEDVDKSLDAVFWLLDSGYDVRDLKGALSEDELLFLDKWKCPPYFWDLCEPNDERRAELHKALLEKHRGNPIMAWRLSLDHGMKMRVSFDEFRASCKELYRLGISAAIPEDSGGDEQGILSVFLSFDPERNGYFGVGNFDRDAYRLLASFVVFAKEKSKLPSKFIKSEELSSGSQSGEGLSYRDFDAATEAMDLTKKESSLLFAGLACGDGKVNVHDVMFLDSWDLDIIPGGEVPSMYELLADGKEREAPRPRRRSHDETRFSAKRMSFTVVQSPF
jgi:hypothetical protein